MNQSHWYALVTVILTLVWCSAPVSAAVWLNETVESAYSVGKYTSLALDAGGDPRITYYNESGEDLKYAHKDAAGWHISTVDRAGSVGMYSSMVIDSGDDARVSYYDAGNTALKYAWQDGIMWRSQVALNTGDVGRFSSISLDLAGNPHISYPDEHWTVVPPDVNLMHAWKQGGTWHSETADGALLVGLYSSIEVRTQDDNLPRISYIDEYNGTLKFAWKTATGSWESVTVDDPAPPIRAGISTSLALDSIGRPHISYATEPNDDLKHAWLDGAGWHTESVDTTGTIGRYTSLALDSYGNPHVSYLDDSSDNLKYAWKKPSGTWEKTVVDSTGSVGQHNAIALDEDNYPRISYYDATNTALKYAWLTGNRAPAALPDSYSVTAGATLSVAAPGVLANDCDLEGDPLAALHQHGPWHGTLDLDADGSFTYTPEAGFTGDDSFVYQASDGDLYSAATVIVTVRPNTRPVAKNDSYTTPRNTMLDVPAPGVLGNDADADGDPLTSVLKTPPSRGKVTLEKDGSFTYTPDSGSTGPDAFSYAAKDHALESKPAWVMIAVVRLLAPLPGHLVMPTDPDGDGICEDLNGNGRLDFSDVVLFFSQMEWIAENEPVEAFDLNTNGRIDFADIVALFDEV